QESNNNKIVLQDLEYKNFGLVSKGNYFNAKAVLERRLRGLSAIRFGTELNNSNDKSLFTLFDGQKFNENIKENLFSTFAEADIYLTNSIAAKVGGRMEHSQLIDR